MQHVPTIKNSFVLSLSLRNFGEIFNPGSGFFGMESTEIFSCAGAATSPGVGASTGFRSVRRSSVSTHVFCAFLGADIYNLFIMSRFFNFQAVRRCFCKDLALAFAFPWKNEKFLRKMEESKVVGLSWDVVL